jgi:hypothetical protein
MWVLATRSRPDNCARFIQAWQQTQARTPVYVRVDQDDPELKIITQLPWPKEFVIAVGARAGLSKSINELYEKFPNEPWYGLLADDLLPHTMFWDQQLVDSAGTDKISYPNDQGQNILLPTHPCVGGELIRNIGWFGLPACYHFFVDTVWQYIGQHLNNLQRLDSVVVEHLHYSYGKSSQDLVYQQSASRYQTDKHNYKEWINNDGGQLIQKLKKIYKS